MSDATRVTITNPTGLVDPRSRGYSHLAEAPAGLRALYVAGQGGEDERGVFAEDFAGQALLTFLNIKRALAAAGASPADIVKTTALMVDPTNEKLGAYAAARAQAWGDVSPPGTLIPVARLALPQMLIEIDAVAYARPRSSPAR